MIEKSREVRLKKVKEIRDRNRSKKSSDIEDGEVDSEGEFYEPKTKKEEKNKPSKEKVEKTSTKSEVKKTDKSEETKAVGSKVEGEKTKEEVDKKTEKMFEPQIISTEPIKRADIEPPKLLEFLPPIQTVAPAAPAAPEPIEAKEPTDYTFSIPSREAALELEAAPLPEREDEADEEWQRREKEERKRIDKMEKLRQTRLKRMQAFQARSEIREEKVRILHFHSL